MLLPPGFVLAAMVTAQPAAPDATLVQQANQAFQARSWEAARAAYSSLVQTAPESGLFHFRLGVAQLQLGEPAEALKRLEKAESLGWPAAQVAFRQASAHARLGNRDAAFRELERAAREGFGLRQLLESDEHLAGLRGDARWRPAVEAVERVARPCLHDARYRELDFWLGTWDVRPNGAPESQPPATNVISKEHDGCVVHENWTAPGSTGQSFNIYDRSRDRWYQTWVDNSGGLHEYSGRLEGGNMVYFAELAPPPGQTGRRHTRLMFFNLGPNKVRQLSEGTTDGGRTWSVNYDLIYTRRRAGSVIPDDEA